MASSSAHAKNIHDKNAPAKIDHHDKKTIHAKDDHHDKKTTHVKDDHHGKKTTHAKDDHHDKKDTHAKDDHHDKKATHAKDDHHDKKATHDKDDHHDKKTTHAKDDHHDKKTIHAKDDHHDKKTTHAKDDHHDKKTTHAKDDHHDKKATHAKDNHHDKKTTHAKDDHHDKKTTHAKDDHHDHHDKKTAHAKNDHHDKKDVNFKNDMFLATCPEKGEHEFLVRDGTATEPFWCSRCGLDGNGRRYKCTHCNYRLHENCYKARLEMKCPFRNGEGHKYITRDATTPFMCNGCREIGVGVRFKCELCYYRLHDKCYQLQNESKSSSTRSPTTTNPNFPGKVFHFIPQHPGNYPGQVCSPCGRDVCGFIFKATDAHGKSVFLHPLCSDVKKEWNQLGMKFLVQHEAKAKCLVCHKKKSKGWTYASSCEKYSLHVDCVMEMILRSWKEGRLEEAKMEKLENVDLAELAEKLEKATSTGKVLKKGGIILLEFVAGMILGNPKAIGALIIGLLV